jgi:hypothetical protein
MYYRPVKAPPKIRIELAEPVKTLTGCLETSACDCGHSHSQSLTV